MEELSPKKYPGDFKQQFFLFKDPGQNLSFAMLTLLIDGEKGIWHLANEGAITWKDFAIKIAEMGGYDSSLIIGKPIKEISKAPMPSYSALASAKGSLMPSLNDAIKCFFKECITLPNCALTPQ